MTVFDTSRVAVAGAQSTIDVSITAQEEAEVGDEVVVDAVVSLSGHDDAVDATVTFAAGETVLSERTVEIADSEVVTFEHAFSDAGERELYVGAGALIDGEEVREVASHAIEVVDGGSDEDGDGSGDGSDYDGDATGDSSDGGDDIDRIERDDRADVSRTLVEEGGWEVTDETERRVFEEEQGPLTVTGDAYTTIYQDAALRSEIAEVSLENVDAPLFVFFTTWIDFSHAIENFPGETSTVMDEIESDARERFEAQLEEQGLTDVAEAGTGTLATATGETARVVDYEATFGVADMSMTLPGGDDLVIEGEGVPIAGFVASWHDGEDAFVAGGAYPVSNYEKTIERTVTDAIELTLVVDLGLTPSEYESELVSLVQSVA